MPAAAICFFLLSGCAGQQAIAVHSLFTACQRPARTALPALDAGEHIGSAVNVAVLLEIVDTQARELADFSAALACYEAQTEGGGPAGRAQTEGGVSRPRSGASEALPRAARWQDRASEVAL